VAAADAHSRPARAIVRSPIGVPLSSPKQPQPASGRRCRTSLRTPAETRKNSAVPARITVAGSASTALLRMAVMLTGNRADAEDLLQAALVKTYRSWSKINDRAALDAYVRRAMVNTHISWWRRRRLDEYPTDELPDQVVADHARESDMAEVVRRALDRLPQRMRAAVMLRYFEDMTEPEIAATLGISLGTVKSTVSRAVARLRIDAELGKDSGA
jgi:RNA polymerase sigma-70 factor (sigma-E family)